MTCLLRQAMPRKSPRNEQQKLEEVRVLLSGFDWTLGYFLCLLFGYFEKSTAIKHCRIEQHASFVWNFLSCTPDDTKTSVQGIVSAMYNHKFSAPVKHRASASRPAPPSKDPTPMARQQLLEWATQTVLDKIISEVSNGTIQERCLKRY